MLAAQSSHYFPGFPFYPANRVMARWEADRHLNESCTARILYINHNAVDITYLIKDEIRAVLRHFIAVARTGGIFHLELETLLIIAQASFDV